MTKAAHRLVRDTSGLGGYHEVFRECRKHQNHLVQEQLEESKRELAKAQTVFYCALHFSAEQQEQMARLIAEARREFDSLASIESDLESAIKMYVVDERGEIPELHESLESFESDNNGPLSELMQEANDSDKINDDLWAKFQALMTQEQREFFRVHKQELIRFSSSVFGRDIDYIISADQPIEATVQSTD